MRKGYAFPFPRRLINLIRAAEGIAFEAARMRRKDWQLARKGVAFPQS
jgi:hypothetical protein